MQLNEKCIVAFCDRGNLYIPNVGDFEFVESLKSEPGKRALCLLPHAHDPQSDFEHFLLPTTLEVPRLFIAFFNRKEHKRQKVTKQESAQTSVGVHSLARFLESMLCSDAGFARFGKWLMAEDRDLALQAIKLIPKLAFACSQADIPQTVEFAAALDMIHYQGFITGTFPFSDCTFLPKAIWGFFPEMQLQSQLFAGMYFGKKPTAGWVQVYTTTKETKTQIAKILAENKYIVFDRGFLDAISTNDRFVDVTVIYEPSFPSRESAFFITAIDQFRVSLACFLDWQNGTGAFISACFLAGKTYAQVDDAQLQRDNAKNFLCLPKLSYEACLVYANTFIKFPVLQF